MRIAVVASRFPVLSETFVLSQVTGLMDRGHDVTVFADEPDQPAHTEVIARRGLDRKIRYWPKPVDDLARARAVLSTGAQTLLARPRTALSAWRRSAGKPRGNLLARRVAVAAREAPFDAILCHFGNVALEMQALRDIGALHGKLAAVFHAYELTTLLREKGRGFYQPLFDRAERLLPVSQHWADALVDLGCPVRKVTVHHMGVSPADIAFSPREPPEEDAPMRLLSVARMVEKKGLRYAIDAVARLAKDGHAVQYRIIGDGPLLPALRQHIADANVGETITLLGSQPHREVMRELSEAHVLLAPSVTAENGDKEGIPVSIMEAMAQGLVVVSTEHSGIPELVEHGVSGHLVPERDVDALTAQLRALVARPESWAALGAAARAKVERDFNQQMLDDDLEEILRGL